MHRNFLVTKEKGKKNVLVFVVSVVAYNNRQNNKRKTTTTIKRIITKYKGNIGCSVYTVVSWGMGVAGGVKQVWSQGDSTLA